MSKLKTKEIALRYGVSERTARRWRASGHWRANDDRVSAVSARERVRDKDPSACLPQLYRELETALNALVSIRYSALAQFERCPDDPNRKAFVAEITADIESAETLTMKTFGKIIVACKANGWRHPVYGDYDAQGRMKTAHAE
jgi:hypothetical protein